jgi:hypothetical protein
MRAIWLVTRSLIGMSVVISSTQEICKFWLVSLDLLLRSFRCQDSNQQATLNYKRALAVYKYNIKNIRFVGMEVYLWVLRGNPFLLSYFEKQPYTTIGQKVGWVSETLWMCCRRQKPLPLREMN